jgi:hypothetical protein
VTFPNINPLLETFLEPTRIHLFGKPFPTLSYNPAPMQGGAGNNTLSESVDAEFEDADPMPPSLVEQVLRRAEEEEGIFARIYGFSFEGHYYKLPRPLLFLVRGQAGSRRPEEDPAVPGGVRQFNTRFTGVEGKDWEFGSDIRVWAVDQHDIAICLDLQVGSYEQVLLQPLTTPEEETAFRGHWQFRNAANFRSRALGPHQER